jgi:hypothetical protein
MVAILCLAFMSRPAVGYEVDDTWKITMILDKEATKILGTKNKAVLGNLRFFFAAHPSEVMRKLRINLQIVEAWSEPSFPKKPRLLEELGRHVQDNIKQSDPIWKTFVLIISGKYAVRGEISNDVDPGIWVSNPDRNPLANDAKPIAVVSMKNPVFRGQHGMTRAIAQAMLLTVGTRLREASRCDKGCCTCSGQPCIMDYEFEVNDQIPKCSFAHFSSKKWYFIGKSNHSIQIVAICGNGIRESYHSLTATGDLVDNAEQCDCYAQDYECQKCCDRRTCTLIQSERCITVTSAPAITEAPIIITKAPPITTKAPIGTKKTEPPVVSKPVTTEDPKTTHNSIADKEEPVITEGSNDQTTERSNGSTTSNPQAAKSDGLWIVWIVVGVVVLLVLIVMIGVLFMCYRKKRSKHGTSSSKSLRGKRKSSKSSGSRSKTKSGTSSSMDSEDKTHMGHSDSATHFFAHGF